MIVLLLIYTTLIIFYIYAGCQSAITNKQYSILILPLPFLLIGGLLDVVLNQVFGRALFLELRYTLTFSQRLSVHYGDSNWRGGMARSIGNFLDKILPHHIH